MSEKPLLLYSANSVNVTNSPHYHWLRIAAIVVGLFVVLVGAANVATRFAEATLGANASLDIFAPAIALTDPSVLASLQGPTITKTNGLTIGGPATTTPIVPVRLTVSSIGVNAKVEQVGKKDDGTMGTPQTFGDVAWYALGQKPGEAGNAVIDGHVNNALTTAGVFDHLSQVQVGDIITVTDASGKSLNFVVQKTETIAADSDPSASIFSTTGPSGLVLITCQGDWVPSAKSFNDRLVVFATLQ